MIINSVTSKKYEDLKADDYFVGKITIIELIEKYTLKNRYTLKDIDIWRYKTIGYIPYFHSKTDLEIDETYEIRGYMHEDGYLRTFMTKKLEHNMQELGQNT